MSMKILVAGDVAGNISVLFKRVEAVNTKAGPFDMLLCVGSFFGPGNLGWESYKSGRCKVPLPVYILGPNDENELLPYPDLAGCEICENVIYLGKQGSFTTKEGLKIGYMSGVQSNDPLKAKDYNYCVTNLQQLEQNLKWDDSKYQGLDILLTSDWPKGISTQAPKPETDDLSVGKSLISRLALLSRPRYHFSGLHGEHYERPPYRNHSVASESTKHTTRFISLANVGNREKKKWLYAFNITPISSIARSELMLQPVGTTDMPFMDAHIALEGGGRDAPHWRYDMDADMEDDGKGNRKRKNKEEGEQRAPPKPMGPCWFCLSGTEVEKHLVVAVGDHTYLALPKGGMTSDHVLILPIGHHPSLVSLPEEISAEVEKFKSAVKKMYKKQGKVPVFWERNYRTQHLQIQVVPVLKEDGNSVKQIFMDTASHLEIDLNEIPSHVPLSQLAQQGQPYFYAETPNKDKLFARIQKNFPLQFGREVVGNTQLLDMEDRVDWKTCQVSKDEETEMTKEFRKMFTPYDFTME